MSFLTSLLSVEKGMRQCVVLAGTFLPALPISRTISPWPQFCHWRNWRWIRMANNGMTKFWWLIRIFFHHLHKNRILNNCCRLKRKRWRNFWKIWAARVEVKKSFWKKIKRMQIYQMLLESNASEQSARMVAMQNASEASGEMIDDLTLVFNKARQANITKEISEISAGMVSIN